MSANICTLTTDPGFNVNASRALGLLLLLSATVPVRADDWDWSLTPYLWAAGIDGTISTTVLDADFSADFEDIVNVLEGGIILAVEAQSGRNLLYSDIVSLALDNDEVADTVGGTLAADVDTLILQAGYARSLSEGFWVEAGGRYWNFDIRFDPAIAASVERSSNWIDVFAGVRIDSSLGENWVFRGRANVGAGDSDLALEVHVDFLRRFANGHALSLGARALDIENNDGGSQPSERNVRFAGLTIGYTFSW